MCNYTKQIKRKLRLCGITAQKERLFKILSLYKVVIKFIIMSAK